MNSSDKIAYDEAVRRGEWAVADMIRKGAEQAKQFAQQQAAGAPWADQWAVQWAVTR